VTPAVSVPNAEGDHIFFWLLFSVLPPSLFPSWVFSLFTPLFFFFFFFFLPLDLFLRGPQNLFLHDSFSVQCPVRAGLGRPSDFGLIWPRPLPFFTFRFFSRIGILDQICFEPARHPLARRRRVCQMLLFALPASTHPRLGLTRCRRAPSGRKSI